jgi:hypothetical protein
MLGVNLSRLPGQSSPLFAELARITEAHNGLWSVEAEEYLLGKAGRG